MTRFACALAGALLLAAADLRADNWPNWRGPENNGVAATTELPILSSQATSLTS